MARNVDLENLTPEKMKIANYIHSLNQKDIRLRDKTLEVVAGYKKKDKDKVELSDTLILKLGETGRKGYKEGKVKGPL